MELNSDADRDAAVDAEAAWEYALQVYARPGVATACLLLQNELDLDVLVLLHLAHVSSPIGAAAITSSDVEAADTCVRNWRNSVVRPLRSARRAIAKDNPALSELRATIQKAELAAERHALMRLAALPSATDLTQTKSTGAKSIRPVVQFYAVRAASVPLLGRADIDDAIELLDRTLFP
ncbi:TIGR02444 family protein [Ottowia thiooxydans]|uniref:TIGR02444 family protein n=1 Tax=Ottowia thiooxydans TaxID=219182 RepID=UPI000412440A|nr:TIGR02444 family protein [Ottowia thiooxydans]